MVIKPGRERKYGAVMISYKNEFRKIEYIMFKKGQEEIKDKITVLVWNRLGELWGISRDICFKDKR